MDIEQFKTFVKSELCHKEIMLDENDEKEISRIEVEYLSPKFIYGNNPRYNITRRAHINGVGDIVVNMEMKNGMIKDICVMGDFFLVGNIGKGIESRLHGVRLNADDVNSALPDRLDNIILNLQKKDFVKLITSKTN